MSRAGSQRAMRPVNGPLRFQTHEVRHLLQLHYKALTAGPGSIADARGRNGAMLRAATGYVRLKQAGRPLMSARSASKAPGAPSAATPNLVSPSQAKRDLEELVVQLLRYRDAIELVSDPLMRSKHAIDLGELLDEQEARARGLAAQGRMPPFTAIVRRPTALAAGIVVPNARNRCDRGMSWRVWERIAWDQQALLSNQDACAREDAMNATKIGLEQFWLVWQPSDLRKLSRVLAAD